MESLRSFGPHLVITEMAVPPGSEWAPAPNGWMLGHVTSGLGYWLRPGQHLELPSGSTLIFSQLASGAIRASQLGPLVLRFFEVSPERLAGVVTLAEKQFLQTAADREGLRFRLLPPSDPVSEKFAELCQRRNGSPLRLRLQLLELFIRAFDHGLGGEKLEPELQPDARARLAAFLKQMPASAMLDLSFPDLVKAIRCTPRHLSRIFVEAVGMCFRDKQAEVRLARARELLETTNSKIYEVAVESRYQSLSLFNFMFRKRFGSTPAKWRQSLNSRKLGRREVNGSRHRGRVAEKVACV